MGISCYACGTDLSGNVRSNEANQLAGCVKCLNVSLVTLNDGVAEAGPLDGFQTLGTMAPDGTVMSGVLKVIPEAIPMLPVLAEFTIRYRPFKTS